MDRPLGALSLLGVLLALPVLLPVLVAAPAGADETSLAPGSHAITLPVDAPTTFRLHRTATGSTFHVGLWYVGAGDSVGEGVRLTVGTTPADAGCGGGAVFRPTRGEPAPLLTTTVSTWTDEPEHACGTAAELFVTVGVPSDPVDAGRRATIVVQEEPPLSAYATDLLSEPPEQAWQPLAPEPSPEATDAGATPADAPVVGPGSHESRLRPGRQALLAVSVDWDQSLRAQVDGSAEATVTILGPVLGDDVASSGPGWAQSHVTSYLHRNSFDPTRAGASLEGVRYVLVGLPPGTPPATVTLTLAVDGEPAGGVPDYIVPAGAEEPTTGRPAPAPADDGAPAPVWLGAGALVLLVAVAIGVRRHRGRRTTRRGARVRGR
ncbi:hypothetical protein FHP29_10885 [Nocardioides albidus]|uniref:Uncharacterized protein n=1 Tax=Nocardioides albidus TaxID=1517589 RepID=A0A5C4VXB9_9ACTN|nr:hypothetical protein [Nocardioides albidus]TNM40537.1 hypothetical protein FHP29_10885 [Nocardioides albidus]